MMDACDAVVDVCLNADSALLLGELAGAAWPPVLALLPNIEDENDRARVREVVRKQLAEAGILRGEAPDPRLQTWLDALSRPDVEMTARIVTGAGGAPLMLRMSLVRAGDMHVLAARCDDEIVVQEVFSDGAVHRVLTPALTAALGPCPPARFTPFTAADEELRAAAADPAGVQAALADLGAGTRTARVLAELTYSARRRAEITMTAHHDGAPVQTRGAVAVFDTEDGRVVATPRIGVDGYGWSTFNPGDETALRGAVDDLIALLPAGDWFASARTPPRHVG